MTSTNSLSEVILVNKGTNTVKYVTHDEQGKKQVLTVFANSNANTGDKKLDAKFNKVFDPGDRITVTDANGKEIKDGKFDAGVVTNLLHAIGGKDINDVAAMQSVDGSGVIFDASAYKNNGITKKMENMLQLFNYASALSPMPKQQFNYAPNGQNWMPPFWGFNPYAGMNNGDFYGWCNPGKNWIEEIIKSITKGKKGKDSEDSETSSSEKDKLTKEKLDSHLKTLGYNEQQRKQITNMLQVDLSKAEKKDLVELIKKLGAIKESDDVTDTTASEQKAEIKKAIDNLRETRSTSAKRDERVKKGDALNTARDLHREIAAPWWFSCKAFNKAIDKINKDNVMEVLDAYENLPANKDKEDLWVAIQKEWSTTAYKGSCYSRIVKALNERAKECGIDIEADEDFRNFNYAFSREFAKTSLFDGDTKEGMVKSLFRIVYKKIKEKEASIQKEIDATTPTVTSGTTDVAATDKKAIENLGQIYKLSDKQLDIYKSYLKKLRLEEKEEDLQQKQDYNEGWRNDLLAFYEKTEGVDKDKNPHRNINIGRIDFTIAQLALCGDNSKATTLKGKLQDARAAFVKRCEKNNFTSCRMLGGEKQLLVEAENLLKKLNAGNND